MAMLPIKSDSDKMYRSLKKQLNKKFKEAKIDERITHDMTFKAILLTAYNNMEEVVNNLTDIVKSKNRKELKQKLKKVDND
jgi:hypothetical protein